MNTNLLFTFLVILFFVPYASNASSQALLDDAEHLNLKPFVSFEAQDDAMLFDVNQKTTNEQSLNVIIGSELSLDENSSAYIKYQINSDEELGRSSFNVKDADTTINFGLSFKPF